MIRPAILVGALAALPSLATAQGITIDGDVTLGYQFNNIGNTGIPDISLNGYSIDFDGDLTFNENFAVGLGFAYNTGVLELDGVGGSLDIDLIGLSVEPVYMHESGAYFGAYYRMGDLDVALLGPLTVGVDTSQYGIFGGYDFGMGHVEVFYGASQLEEDSLIPVGINADIRDYGISASYQVMPQLEVYGSLLRTDIEDGATISITAYSVGADYDVGNGIGVYGAIGGSVIDLSDLGAPDDVTAFGLTLGATYDLREAGSDVPVILSAEYSRTMLDLSVLSAGLEPEIDRFALGVTIPIGNGSGDPLNSNTRVARGDYRSAVGAIFNSF